MTCHHADHCIIPRHSSTSKHGQYFPFSLSRVCETQHPKMSILTSVHSVRELFLTSIPEQEVGIEQQCCSHSDTEVI